MKNEVKAGDVYYSFRSDIEPPHNKYQLYFDDETVLLINTERNRISVSVTITVEDCPILEYDSHLCIDSVFTFQKNCRVLKVTQVSTPMLKRIKELIHMSNLLTGKQIKRIEKSISLVLAERDLF